MFRYFHFLKKFLILICKSEGELRSIHVSVLTLNMSTVSASALLSVLFSEMELQYSIDQGFK